jgi:hypothetical protein
MALDIRVTRYYWIYTLAIEREREKEEQKNIDGLEVYVPFATAQTRPLRT